MAFLRHVEVDVGPKNGQGFKIQGLKIGFSIEKTNDPSPNTGKVQIYNLSLETNNAVCVAGNRITLKAGYEDETIAPIFFGDVTKGLRRKDGSDYVTELEVKDGRTSVMAAQVSISYDKDTDALTIVQGLLDAIGLPSKGTNNIPAGAKYPGSLSDIGNAADILRTVLNKFGLMYTIQNKQLYIMKPDEKAQTVGLNLTPETGLLTIPQPLSDKTPDDDVEREPANKWGFKTLLFPELMPGTACKVESSTLKGEVMITKTVFSGDNWTGDFTAEIEAAVL
jgi:hypothetical protein